MASERAMPSDRAMDAVRDAFPGIWSTAHIKTAALLDRFAADAVREEREACAEICRQSARSHELKSKMESRGTQVVRSHYIEEARDCERKIRARGEEEADDGE